MAGPFQVSRDQRHAACSPPVTSHRGQTIRRASRKLTASSSACSSRTCRSDREPQRRTDPLMAMHLEPDDRPSSSPAWPHSSSGSTIRSPAPSAHPLPSARLDAPPGRRLHPHRATATRQHLEPAAIPGGGVLDRVGRDLTDQDQHVIQPGEALTEHARHESPGLPDRWRMTGKPQLRQHRHRRFTAHAQTRHNPAQVTRAGSTVPRISVPRTSTRRERRNFQPRPPHPGQAPRSSSRRAMLPTIGPSGAATHPTVSYHGDSNGGSLARACSGSVSARPGERQATAMRDSAFDPLALPQAFWHRPDVCRRPRPAGHG